MATTGNLNKGRTGFPPCKVFIALALAAMLCIGVNDAMAKGGSGGKGGGSGKGGDTPPPPPPPDETAPPPDETTLATFKLCTGSRSGESGRSIEVTENGKTIIKRIRCD